VIVFLARQTFLLAETAKILLPNFIDKLKP
jgi:hypothetical protein